MKKTLVMCSLVVALFSSCTKQLENLGIKSNTPTNEFVKYTIAKGQQSSDKNAYTQVQYTELKFVAKFDSTAIYQTVNPLNQKDVNKLFGFSDNNANHHQFSARFGWRWTNGALRLFTYVYNNGVLSLKEIGTVAIGEEVPLSIKVSGNSYIFTMRDKVETMERSSTTAQAVGYKLYPYFGGDEMAPHDINIWIKEIK